MRFALLFTVAVVTYSHVLPSAMSYRLVCYYPNWAGDRSLGGNFSVSDIDPNICTHFIYAFAVLDGTTFRIKVFDPTVDITNQGYQHFVDLKKQNPSLKTMIAIGGWTDSQDDKYSNLVANDANIKTFVASVIGFLNVHKFDGLDLDWEYPGKRETDIAGFAKLITSLRDAFGNKYILSAAVSVNQATIDDGYDVPKMKDKLDFINLMAYDYHGSWEPTVDHHAPLYKRSWETADNVNVNFTVHYWIEKGLLASQINLGIPLYGKSWTLNSTNTNVTAPAYGPGKEGHWTNEAGSLAYYEICYNIYSYQWISVQDPLAQTGPYAYSRDTENKTWVGYDDISMVIVKGEYVTSMGLGGAMVWDISQDDFDNKCGNGSNPLINAIYETVVASNPETSVSASPSTNSFPTDYSSDSPVSTSTGTSRPPRTSTPGTPITITRKELPSSTLSTSIQQTTSSAISCYSMFQGSRFLILLSIAVLLTLKSIAN